MIIFFIQDRLILCGAIRSIYHKTLQETQNIFQTVFGSTNHKLLQPSFKIRLLDLKLTFLKIGIESNNRTWIEDVNTRKKTRVVECLKIGGQEP
jgi:hypothetical protein